MSAPSELIMNTQNSFQTHAQRGANIVMRGGKKNRRTRKKRGGRLSAATDFWRIFTETPKKYREEDLKKEGYPNPKTKENLNKIVDFCKKNVIFGRTETNFSMELPPDFEITQQHVSSLAPYYIDSTKKGYGAKGWSCDVCDREDFKDRGEGRGNNEWHPEYAPNFMAVACDGYWATCIDCIDKIDTFDKNTSKNFSIAELKKKGLDVTDLEKEIKTKIENIIRDLEESKTADILSEYKTFAEAKNVQDACNDITSVRLENQITEIRAKIREIKKNCRKNWTKKNENRASKGLEKIKRWARADPGVKYMRKLDWEQPDDRLFFGYGQDTSSEGGRKRRRKSKRKKRRRKLKRKKSRRKSKRSRRRKRRR